jgi:formylglycine-generating enzyme required for sulfatase activity
MIKVEGGTFIMGASDDMDDHDSDELPKQEVTLSSYSIGETEVTQGLWFAVMGERPASPDGDNHPMKGVSHDECMKFIAKLNQLTGRHFHLPTEAQWEFAARGGNQSHNYWFSGSNNIDEVAWYSVNSWDMGKGNPDFGNHPVGMKKPNELGIYDMSGNVWEWCLETFVRYDGKPKTDPGLNDSIQGSFRCNRGGSWDYIATSARVNNRRNRTRDFRNFNLGRRRAE